MSSLISTKLDELTLAERAAKDPQFAAQLMNDPKRTLSNFINMELPTDLEVLIHQESDNNLHIVLPAFGAPQNPEMDIADDEILAGCTWGPNCRTSIG